MRWMARLALLLGGLPFLVDGVSTEHRILCLAAGISTGVVLSMAATYVELQRKDNHDRHDT